LRRTILAIAIPAEEKVENRRGYQEEADQGQQYNHHSLL
jgi:hypothetical protein